VDGKAPAISLQGLTKYYGRQRGIEDVTFDVAPGEVFGFLGPNGAGKTTTMRTLLGLLHVTRGTAQILGVDVATAPPTLRDRIGYLPGGFELYENLSGHAYLTFLARMRGRDLSRQFEQLSDRLDLDLSRHIHDLSKGNRQKIGVVQAFMHEPDVLVLDEPTGGLDPLAQREFETLLEEQTARGVGVLLSSHVLGEVDHLAQRVAIIDQGRLVTVQQIDELKQQAARTIDLDFPASVPAGEFTVMPGVTEAFAHGTRVSCTVVGAETDVLRRAVELGVTSVHTHEASLEDVFFSLVGRRD
jgi:ABC-2 type transport system ATP-binding protein